MGDLQNQVVQALTSQLADRVPIVEAHSDQISEKKTVQTLGMQTSKKQKRSKDLIPTVTVIILNFNGYDHLETCLLSLREVDFPKEQLEIIIVDNGSSDKSIDFIYSKFPEIKLIRNETNLGFSRAANQGAKSAKGKYLAFLNNDMRVSKNWLKALLQEIQKDPETGCIGSLIMNWDGSAVDFWGRSDDLFGLDPTPSNPPAVASVPKSNKYTMFASGGAMLIPKDIFKQLGGFDVDYFMYHEDVDLGWRLWLRGYKCMLTPLSVVYHKGGASSRELPLEFVHAAPKKYVLFTMFKNFEDSNLEKFLPLIFYLFLYGGRWWDPAQKMLPEITQEFRFSLEQLIDKRIEVQKTRVISDEEIFLQVGHPFDFLLQKPAYDLIRKEIIDCCSKVHFVVNNVEAARSTITEWLDAAHFVHERHLVEELHQNEQSVQALLTQVQEITAHAQGLSSQVKEKEQSVRALNAQVEEKEQSVQALSAQVKKKDKSVHALSAQVKKKEQSEQALQAQMAEKEQTVQALSVQVAEQDKQMLALSGQLYEITYSKAWRLALIARRIRVWLAPPGSWRARVLRKIYSLVRAGLNPLVHYLRKDRQKAPAIQAIPTSEALDLNKSSDVNNEKWYLAKAQVALQSSLDRLKIPLNSIDVLSHLKTTLTGDKFAQMLEDLFKLEQFISAPHANDPVYPLTQASKLPEITTKGHRRRILFVTSQFPHPFHGGGTRVINFIKILSQNNEIYLSSCFDPNNDANALENLKPFCHSIQTIPYWQFGRNQTEISTWLKGTQMDIVHYEWPRSLENYDPGFGKIHIFTYMEAVSLRLQIDLYRLQPLTMPWLEKFSEFIYALHLELADAAKLTARIAVTTKDGDYFKELYPYQIYSVLNHGVIFNEFSLPDVEPDLHTLVFVGNYAHYPNADAMEFFFKEIWPAIYKELPDARIYVVGPNPPETITRFADGQHVIVTGGVIDHRPYIQKATIGIAPLINGAGMRGKVIDYAALHRTFVASSLAMTDMVFKDGIDYYCADSAQEFAQKIITLLKHSDVVSKMSDSAFNTARQNYDTSHLTEYLVRLYEHLEAQGLQDTLPTSLESTAGPMSVQEWLSYYEKRTEIPQHSEKDNNLSRLPKVSILVLTYNNFQINQLCLRSIYCNTTYPNLEVIVVDNASTDETPGWLNTFSKTHPNLRLVLNTENRGFAGGNNQAASLATGEYLIFLNNDTVVTNGWVERLLAHMRSNSKIGMVGPVTNSTGNEARVSVGYRSPVEMEAFSDWRARYMAGQAFDIRMLAFYCVMVRKGQFDALGGLDERFLVGMFEDDDLAVRYHLQGQRVICAEDVFIHHFQGASFGNLKKTHYAQLFKENKKRYEEKWGRKWEPYQFRKET